MTTSNIFKNLPSASIRDIGYSAASSGDTLQVLALELNKRYPNGLSDEALDELKDGMTGRKAELVGEQRYLVEGNSYTPVEPKAKLPEGAETITVTVQMACGMSSYDFGKLKSERPNLYAILGAVRTATSKYVSNRMRALQSAMKAEQSGGRTRGENKTFDAAVSETLASLWKRSKTAHGKGDPSATTNKAEFVKIITAFANKV